MLNYDNKQDKKYAAENQSGYRDNSSWFSC